MRRIRRGWAALRENPRGGASMLIALFAFALLMFLTLLLLYTASVQMSRANRKMGQERCRFLADSFAETLDTELRRFTASGEQNFWNEPVWDDTLNRAAGEDSFYCFVNRLLSEHMLPVYDPDDSSSVLCYEMDEGNLDEVYGELEIRLRQFDLAHSGKGFPGTFWDETAAVHDGTFNSYGSFDYDNAEQGARTAEVEQRFIRYCIQVDAVAKLGDDAILRSETYYREDCCQPYYTWHVVNLDSRPANFSQYQPMEGIQASPIDGVPVYWHPDAGGFFLDEQGMNAIEPAVWYWDETVYDETSDSFAYVRHTWNEEVVISYVYYDESGQVHETYQHFIPTYELDRASAQGGEQ